MKAITLTQPWASLMALGAKRQETRSWPTTLTGEVAITAAKNFPKDCRELCMSRDFGRFVPDWKSLPTSCVLAVGTLVKCVRTESEFARLGELATPESFAELLFGDYSPFRFVHVYTDIKPLREPVPCRGALGYWELPSDIEALVRAQL